MVILGGQATRALLVSAAIFGQASFFFPQFDTVDDIPRSYFSKQRTMSGRVERVVDGDTLRVQHCPTRFSSCSPTGGGRTMSIRIYAVDCPEIQKRSTDPPSQPWGEEAKDYTTRLVLGKKVRVKLLRKDQYGRAVAKVETRRSFIPFLGRRKDVSVELVRRGLATIYTGGGAVYDGQEDLLQRLEEEARRRKRGVWSLSDKERISPGEFKRQQKALKYDPAGASR